MKIYLQSGQKHQIWYKDFLYHAKNKMDRLKNFCAKSHAKIMKKAKNDEKCRCLKELVIGIAFYTKIDWLLIFVYIMGCMASQLTKLQKYRVI